MLFRLFFCLTLALPFCLLGFTQESALIVNMDNEAILPKNFRTAKAPFQSSLETSPSRLGLDELPISGSGQFSEQSLKTVLKEIPSSSSIYIVDLRQESHGFFNGTAVSWYAARDWGNIGKTLGQIAKLEKDLLDQSLKKKDITLSRIVKKDPTGEQMPEVSPFPFTVNIVQTEDMLTSKLGLHYIRIPVTDHLRPNDEQVDRFISFVTTLPKDHWIHFHCGAGVGRTTTFMALYDMMMNADRVTFEEIINRQWLIGGLNLLKLSAKSWKLPYNKDRIEFLKNFYEYARLNKGKQFQQNWTDYLRHKQAAESS